ncbi:MAG: 3-methylornithyl-N6-L-lysine dehydrogenase PylD [Anaerovoracaceae bacterium]
MTRLVTEWISHMEQEIEAYDKELIDKLGINLVGLTSKTCGYTEQEFYKKVVNHKIAVIPITAGEGVIGSFSEAVAAILRKVKADVFITEKTDVAGMKEGLIKGADILFMADDEEFIALNVKTGAVADNNYCTAAGYIVALEKMAGTLEREDVLVLGYGIIGKKVVELLKKKGAAITVFDKNKEKTISLESQGIPTLAKEGEICRFHYIIDATDEGAWLHKDMLAADVRMASMGIPLSLDQEAYDFHKDRIIHDYLEIGTAVMLGTVI